MTVIALTGTRRDGIGKGSARKARAAGLIPGVLYGREQAPIPLNVSDREFELAVRRQGGNPIIGLTLDGSEYTALIRDIQYDPISHDIIHLDFQHISLTEEIEVEVAIRLVGLAIGVKDGGGILEPIQRELKVRCLPTAIPASVDVDVSALNIGDSVHVSEISVPGVTILTEPEVTVATVVPPTVHVVEAPAEEAPAIVTEPEEPEVIKGKKEEAEAGDEKEKGKEKEK